MSYARLRYSISLLAFCVIGCQRAQSVMPGGNEKSQASPFTGARLAS